MCRDDLGGRAVDSGAAIIKCKLWYFSLPFTGNAPRSIQRETKQELLRPYTQMAHHLFWVVDLMFIFIVLTRHTIILHAESQWQVIER